MTLVEKQWDDDGTVTVSQEWLDRAKELTWQHGIVRTTIIARTLEHEMGRDPYDREVHMLIVIAMRETAEERAGYWRAINDLRAEAERVNAPGPDHNLDLWAIYLAGVSFLENRVGGS